MNTFSASGVIKEGWEIFKKRPWFLIGAIVLSGLIVNICTQILTALGDQIGTVGQLGAFLINLGINTLYGAGLIHFFLKAHDNVMAAKLMDLWHPSVFWNYLAATVLLVIIIVLGLVLLIIPGIILALALYFTTYLIVDRKMGPIEALKESARITKGHRWELLVLSFLIVFVVLAGIICLFVGIFVAIPVTSLAMVAAYRKLETSSGARASVA